MTCGAYHGVIIAYNASTLAQVQFGNDTPTGTQAGIWMSGGGLVGGWHTHLLQHGQRRFQTHPAAVRIMVKA